MKNVGWGWKCVCVWGGGGKLISYGCYVTATTLTECIYPYDVL